MSELGEVVVFDSMVREALLRSGGSKAEQEGISEERVFREGEQQKP